MTFFSDSSSLGSRVGWKAMSRTTSMPSFQCRAGMSVMYTV